MAYHKCIEEKIDLILNQDGIKHVIIDLCNISYGDENRKYYFK